MTNVIPGYFPQARPIRAVPDDSLRSDCERLMRRLVKDGRTPRHELQVLADVLDRMIERESGGMK